MARYDMTDDRGIFQGGRFGRPFGRIRDWFERSTQDPMGNRDAAMRESLGDKMEVEGEVYTPIMHEGTPYDVDQGFSYAREAALDFDPSNPESVRIMQKRLNESGVIDEQLSIDGVFGPKTEAAVRKLQDIAQYNPGQRFGFRNEPEAPSQLSSPAVSQGIQKPRY